MILKKIILFAVLLILALLVLYLMQRTMIYFPAREQPDPKDFFAQDMQQVHIAVADGFTLNSWFKPPQDKKPVILYLHGNAGHIGYRMRLARQFISAGLGVLLLEYRGYGGNPGKPTESGLYQDGRAAMHFLHERGINDKHIVLYGESLGTGVATQLATEFAPCALVLQSPYTSFTALARYHYFWLPLPLMDKYDSLSRIRKIHAPLLMIHGRQDIVVPYQQGLTLFNHANQPKKWIEFPAKGHNDLWDDNFATQVINFINDTCDPHASEQAI